MMQKTVTIQIPFELLFDAIASLELEEKRRLWQLLDREIRPAQENHGKAFDWLHDEPDLYTLEDGKPV